MSDKYVESFNIMGLPVQVRDKEASEIANNNRDYIEFKNKKIITIGDSYDLNSASGVSWKGWGTALKEAHPEITIYDYPIGGAGFVTYSPDNKTFINGLYQAYNDVTDRDSITDIVIMGGYNDASLSQTRSNIQSAIAAFYTYANTNFKNANIHIGFCGVDANRSGQQKRCFIYAGYYEYICSLFNISYINNLNYVLLNRSLLLQIDGNANSLSHPNNDGCDYLARALYQHLKGNVINVFYQYSIGSFTFSLKNDTVYVNGITELSQTYKTVPNGCNNNVWVELMNCSSLNICWGGGTDADDGWKSGVYVKNSNGTIDILNIKYLNGRFYVMYDAGTSIAAGGFLYIPSICSSVTNFY